MNIKTWINNYIFPALCFGWPLLMWFHLIFTCLSYYDPRGTRIWIPLLFNFLNKVADVVCVCVMGYFVTFNICYTATLQALVTMIDTYLDFLSEMVDAMTRYPAVLYLSVDVLICMIAVVLIIWIINPGKYAK